MSWDALKGTGKEKQTELPQNHVAKVRNCFEFSSKFFVLKGECPTSAHLRGHDRVRADWYPASSGRFSEASASKASISFTISVALEPAVWKIIDWSPDAVRRYSTCIRMTVSRVLSSTHRPYFGQSAQWYSENTMAYFTLLKRIYEDKHNKYRTIIATNILRSFMLDVYDKVLKKSPEASGSLAGSRKEEIYNMFIRLVHEHGTEHHDAAFYADKLCITSRYLSSVTCAVANESPKQKISSFLVQEIKILLTFSELTLQQISDRLNFPDQSHMGRFFKQKTGLSPNEYRKKEMAM